MPNICIVEKENKIPPQFPFYYLLLEEVSDDVEHGRLSLRIKKKLNTSKRGKGLRIFFTKC